MKPLEKLIRQIPGLHASKVLATSVMVLQCKKRRQRRQWLILTGFQYRYMNTKDYQMLNLNTYRSCSAASDPMGYLYMM